MGEWGLVVGFCCPFWWICVLLWFFRAVKGLTAFDDRLFQLCFHFPKKSLLWVTLARFHETGTTKE
jgi:hypothetical protein